MPEAAVASAVLLPFLPAEQLNSHRMEPSWYT